MQLDELPLRGAGDQAHEDLVAITDEQVHGGAQDQYVCIDQYWPSEAPRLAIFTDDNFRFFPLCSSASVRTEDIV